MGSNVSCEKKKSGQKVILLDIPLLSFNQRKEEKKSEYVNLFYECMVEKLECTVDDTVIDWNAQRYLYPSHGGTLMSSLLNVKSAHVSSRRFFNNSQNPCKLWGFAPNGSIKFPDSSWLDLMSSYRDSIQAWLSTPFRVFRQRFYQIDNLTPSLWQCHLLLGSPRLEPGYLAIFRYLPTELASPLMTNLTFTGLVLCN